MDNKKDISLEKDRISKDVSLVAQKAKKLSAVIYLLTDNALMDPLAGRLRSLSITVLYDLNRHGYSTTKKTASLMIDLIDLAIMNGVLSDMNGAILRSEYLKIGNPIMAGASESVVPIEQSVKNVKAILSRNDYPKKKEVGVTPVNRRDSILLSMEKGKEYSVKDISSFVTDCSEKTIQRELLSLVSLGTLGKTGERRWSKYSKL
ncbi:MAG: hypothetical protein AAB682_02490 [Patescibacteria group bacterium]